MARTLIDELYARFGLEYDRASFRRFETAAERAKGKLDAITGAATRIGFALSAIGVAAAVPLRAIASAGIATDAAMRQLEARTGATTEQLARFKRQAYEVGSQLPLNTADIIRAQTAFVQLGNSIDEAVQATPGIAQFAVAAEGADVESSARYASIALKAFGLEAGDATDVLDQMLLAETKTAATAVDIGNAFRYSGQSAADAGLDTATYIATLGTLAGSGRSAEESSIGLNALLTKLAGAMSGIGEGGKLVGDALAALGIEFEDVQGTMRSGPQGFVEFIRLLREQSKELDPEILTGALRALVGESYASSFSYLVQNVDELNQVTEAGLDASGESARQAAIKMEGLSGAVESYKAQWDTVKNVISDLSVAAPLERLLRWAADLMGWLVETNEQGELIRGWLIKAIGAALKFGLVLGGVGAALLSTLASAHALLFLLNMSIVQQFLGGIVSAFGLVRAAAVQAALTAQAAWLRFYLTLKLGGWRGLALTMFEPIRLKAIATFAAIRTHSIAAWASMRAGAAAGLASFATFAKSPVASTRAALSRMVTFAVASFRAIRISAMLTWTAITLGAVLLVALLIAAWKPVSTFFKGLWQGFTDNIAPVRDALGRLADAFGPIGTAASAVFRGIGAAFKWVAGLFGEQTDAGRSFGEWLANFLVSSIDQITAWVEGIKTALKAVGGWLKWPFEQLGKLLPGSDAPEGPLSRLTDAGRAIVDTIAEGARTATPLKATLAAGVLALPSVADLTPSLPVGPAPAQVVAPAVARNTSLTLNLAPGAIAIQGDGQDPEAIARAVQKELERAMTEEWRSVAEQADSNEGA